MCERKTAITDTKKWGGHLAERIPLLITGMKHYSLQHTLTVSLFYMMPLNVQRFYETKCEINTATSDNAVFFTHKTTSTLLLLHMITYFIF